MKKYLILGVMVGVALSSCRKNCYKENNHMPRAVVMVDQKLTEISKTNGNTPSVVLIGGHQSEIGTWSKVYQQLNPSTTVFTYNRAGVGLSENISGPRDARTIALEMKKVLETNNIKAPYIFVAHSMGGIYARMFYHQNPSLVKGMVLVDATHENQLDSLLSLLPLPERVLALAQMIAVNDSLLRSLPDGSVKEEFRANFATNYIQIKQYPPITNIPMYIITSTKVTNENPAFVADIHAALHQQWALSAGAKGRFVATSKSGHQIQEEEPSLVSEGIRWVLSK